MTILKTAVFILLLSFLAFTAVGIPILNRFSKVTHDHLAACNLLNVGSAQEQYQLSTGRYGTLDELAKAGLLESHLAGDRQTLLYHYWISDLSPTTFCAHADRKDPGSGNTDFSISENGALHGKRSETIGSVPCK